MDRRELHLSSQDGGEGRGTALNFQQLLPAEMWRTLAVSGPVGIADGAGFPEVVLFAIGRLRLAGTGLRMFWHCGAKKKKKK